MNPYIRLPALLVPLLIASCAPRASTNTSNLVGLSATYQPLPDNAKLSSGPVSFVKGGKTYKLIEALSRYSDTNPAQNDYLLVAYADEPSYDARSDTYTYIPTDIYRRSGETVEHYGMGMTVLFKYWDGKDWQPYCHEATQRKLSSCTINFSDGYIGVGLPLFVPAAKKANLTTYSQPAESIRTFAAMADRVRPANIVPVEQARRNLTPEEEAKGKAILVGATAGLGALLYGTFKWFLGANNSNDSAPPRVSSASPVESATCTGSLARDWTRGDLHYYDFKLSSGRTVTYFTEYKSSASWLESAALQNVGPFYYLYRSPSVGADKRGWYIARSGRTSIEELRDYTTTSSALEALKLAASKYENCQIR